MSAIKPHYAEFDETTELEERYYECLSEAQGDLGELEKMQDELLCPTPEAVIDQSHAGLMADVYIREVALRELEGSTITPGYRGDDVALFVDRPVTGPVWNPMLEVETTSLLSWTSKMGTPSFSLPAGAPQMGGACPGAIAGQSVVPDEKRLAQAKSLLHVLQPYRDRLPAKDRLKVRLEDTICSRCYATGGQYATGSVQFHQMVRFAWARKAIRIDMEGRPIDFDDLERSAFVAVMRDAIDNVDFKLQGEAQHWRGRRFFRIHDSGDFFDTRYLKAWCLVAEHYRDHELPITFWAPSRIWAEGEDKVRQLAELRVPDNLVIRPSAYHVNERGPVLDGYTGGWAAASTVYHHDAVAQAARDQDFNWNCRVYESKKGKKSCRDVEGANPDGSPSGKTGCRTCWVHPHLIVNYTEH